MKHLLLRNHFSYKKRVLNGLVGFFYNKNIGAWIDENDGSLLVKNIKFPGIASKKEDIETGEDQKGR